MQWVEYWCWTYRINSVKLNSIWNKVPAIFLVDIIRNAMILEPQEATALYLLLEGKHCNRIKTLEEVSLMSKYSIMKKILRVNERGTQAQGGFLALLLINTERGYSKALTTGQVYTCFFRSIRWIPFTEWHFSSAHLQFASLPPPPFKSHLNPTCHAAELFVHSFFFSRMFFDQDTT